MAIVKKNQCQCQFALQPKILPRFGAKTAESISQFNTFFVGLNTAQMTCHGVISYFCQCNKTVCIRHQCRKTNVLSCHRCLINTGVEKLAAFIID